ncbi:aminotransferase class III-fold pyridoxal phosphate-dependent enzyme [Salmonella enterica subsp. enterica]|nr:aminotransferase class III-fold pyridoxal phosphate-dependent enzyme [Salmonella enterica subsp. enterica]
MRQHGIMLALTKCKSGMGRTDTLFAAGTDGRCGRYNHVCEIDRRRLSAGGVTGRADIDGRYLAPGLGGTYAGNPIACRRRAVAVLNIFEQENLLQRQIRQHAARWPDGDSGNAP